MSNLAGWRQTSIERKRYTISYDRWLDPDEQLSDTAFLASPTTDPLLVAEGAVMSNNNREVTFFMEGGVPGTVYLVKVVATTSEGQIKEDDIQVEIT